MKKKTSPTITQTLASLKQFLWIHEKPWILRMVGAASIMFFMIGLNVGVPLIFRYVINLFGQAAARQWIALLLIGYGIAWTLSQITSQVRSYLITNVLEEVVNRFSLALFDHLHALSLRFHLERHTGAISSAITRAYHGIEALFWGIFLFMIPTLLEIIFAIIVIMILYGFLYGAAITCVLVLYITASIIGLEWSHAAHENYNQKRTSTKAYIIDSLLNFETVKYFTNQRFEHDQCKKALDEQTQAAHIVNVQAMIIHLAQALIIGTGLTLIMWHAGYSVINHTMKVSDFVLINTYILQFVIPLSYFGYILQQIRKGFVDMSDSIALLERTPEIVDAPQALELKADHATITFDHVSFYYDRKRPILDDISFTVPAGHTIALVGPTGSGKSTISRLLFRLYDVTSGRILINGHDIREVTQRSLHALMSIVSQDTVLFNNTLYYNIAYGKPNATQDEVLEAAHLAHLEGLIEKLPAGLDTIVGERGLMVSGGEKQRVAIARALIKKPIIYVFDEATSALDTRTEKEIQQNVKEISEHATALIIAHRLSTVVDADEILVMDKGKIIERGTHDELLTLGGLYAQLWQEQAQE